MATIEHQFIDADTELWKNDRGSLRISRPAPNVLVMKFSGYFDADFLNPLIATQNRVIIAGPTRLFSDWEEMTDYASECRTKLTDWTVSVRKGGHKFILLIRSKLVAFGVNAANIALGGILEVHTERRHFDEALNEAIAQARKAQSTR